MANWTPNFRTDAATSTKIITIVLDNSDNDSPIVTELISLKNSNLYNSVTVK